MNKGVFVYVAFYACIGFAVWVCQSAWPLIFMVFQPTIRTRNDDDIENIND